MRCPCCATRQFYRTNRPEGHEGWLTQVFTVWARCRRCGFLRRVLRPLAYRLPSKEQMVARRNAPPRGRRAA